MHALYITFTFLSDSDLSKASFPLGTAGDDDVDPSGFMPLIQVQFELDQQTVVY